MEGYLSIWTQGLSAMHHGVPGAWACVTVTSNTGDAHGTQALHWMNICSGLCSGNCISNLTSEGNEVLRVRSNCVGQTRLKSRYCVWTERLSLELILPHWRKDGNANFPKLDPLGVLQSWCLSPAWTGWEDRSSVFRFGFYNFPTSFSKLCSLWEWQRLVHCSQYKVSSELFAVWNSAQGIKE